MHITSQQAEKQAAAALGLLGEYKLIMGIPLSVSGKSPFFDRGKP